MTRNSQSIRRLVIVSMLAACGLILFVYESFLPGLPWFRPGLGNIATILALLTFGFGDALKVTLLRVVLGALILGRLFTPLFVFAFSGGLASAVAMFLVMKFTRNLFGPIGISVLGAIAHNIVQLLIAYLFFVKSVEIFIFIPIFIATGVIMGNITGLVVAIVLDRGHNLFIGRVVYENSENKT
ncbi:MAG: Gx transporter family protein [Candidatus Latescibacteria bacterium]|nr:Gx transporter family protein [Candidatus Latescibacterota bacterium]